MYFLIALAIIAIILKLPSVKGFFRELRIRILLKFLDKDNYFIINDVMIRNIDGNIVQIDHIVVSIYGIFIIETKNYKGWIFGSENSKNWTPVIYKTKNNFYNQILQNKGHVKALQDILIDYPNIKFIPIVVFALKADFKKLNVTSHVIYSIHLLKTIKMYTEKNILQSDLDNIYNSIVDANYDDKVTRKEHVERFQKNNYKVECEKCPWCGSNLIERQGKYGKFTGCSNYPKCRFILKGKW